MSLLEVKGLNSYYGDSHILFDVSLRVEKSEVVALLGRNGAGKSTTLKSLMGVVTPRSGSVKLDGAEIAGRKSHRIARAGMQLVHEERRVFGSLDVEENLVLAGLTAKGKWPLERIYGMFPRLKQRRGSRGTDLSGGQWQRIALARALCAVKLGAGMVLLDEPTAQLDVRGEAEIFNRILEATRQTTTILISHRFSTVRHADRICVLEHGKVVELGNHDELMAFGGRYRKMFELQASRFGGGPQDDGDKLDEAD